MDKISKINLVIVFTFLLFCLIGILIWLKKTNDLEVQLHKEYPYLGINESLNCKVADIYIIPIFGFKSNPFFRRVTTYNSKKFALFAESYANPKSIYLEYEMNIGDSIKKNAGSDTLIVINSKGIYLFKLKENWY